MLDASVIRRDARNCMADWPVTIRHYYDPDVPQLYHEVTAALSRTDQIAALMPGAILDDYTLSVFYIQGDLAPPPSNWNRVDVQMRDGSWREFQVTHTPDNYDPLSEFMELSLGTPEK
jgi:hypothetical protein